MCDVTDDIKACLDADPVSGQHKIGTESLMPPHAAALIALVCAAAFPVLSGGTADAASLNVRGELEVTPFPRNYGHLNGITWDPRT